MTDTLTSGPLSQSVERMRREFERWSDAAMQQGNRALDVVGLRGADRPWTPAVDLIETPTDVQIDVDLPGIDPGAGRGLADGQHAHDAGTETDAHSAARRNRARGRADAGAFSARSIPMPAPVIADSVSAELKNGVLQIRLMKSEKARSLKIPVHAEPPARDASVSSGIRGARSLAAD